MKVLIVADKKGWAYDNIAKYVQTHFASEHQVTITYLDEVTKNVFRNPFKAISARYNRCLKRISTRNVRFDVVIYLGFYFIDHSIDIPCKLTVVGIYTTGFPPAQSAVTRIEEFRQRYLDKADAVIVGTKQLVNEYSAFHDSVYFCNMGFDENFWSSDSLTTKLSKDATSSVGKVFTIGWTGNPDRAFKGFHTIIEPAIEQLRIRYPQVRLKTQFSGSLTQLRNFYSDVDVVVIASDADAGPSLFAEASLMGIPTVTTRVGWPEMVVEDGVNGFIVDREVGAFVEKISELIEQPKVLYSAATRIRNDYIAKLGHRVLRDNWSVLFEHLERKL